MRLNRFQNNIQQLRDFPPLQNTTENLRMNELGKAKVNLTLELVYVNIFVLIGGGFISYFLAKKNIEPIEKAHEEQSRFTSDASHELRTPLAAMKTELEVALRDKSVDIKELKRVITSNLEEIDKLSKLSDMLLNLSKVEKTELTIAPIDLVKITNDTIKSFNENANRISLKCEQSIIATGNDTAIADLIKILIDNALAYSPKNTPININLSIQDEVVKFEIINTGPGIKPDELPYIFNRFYRADSSRTENDQKGYGLGLALAKKIVDSHAGNIFATSIPDEATTFTFTLPAS